MGDMSWHSRVSPCGADGGSSGPDQLTPWSYDGLARRVDLFPEVDSGSVGNDVAAFAVAAITPPIECGQEHRDRERHTDGRRRFERCEERK